MANLTQASARTAIDVAEASEIARMARGGDPNVLAREELQSLLGDSALVLDGFRRRPRYFDGRFLTGADLTRDQAYVRQRQADLARAGGSGVVTGLEVSLGADPSAQTLVIQPGHGVTPSGDLVLVASQRAIVAVDLAVSERLDATLGLRRQPLAPLGRRTGLFVLALRPVEFTANPIAAYPTTITGQRHVEDGDVIEATAITLIPYPDTGGAATLAEARRTVARKIFAGDAGGLPQDALPLAMVAMERGSIRWIDLAMARRETGADTPLQVSMGARPRALAEAFVLQYLGHLADVLRDRAAAGLPPAFAAAQYFAALPAAGQLPAGAILSDALGFRQLWFPPAVDVEVSFIPFDEIASLVEESLTLPPIDLLGDPADLDATSVVVLAPVTRQRLQRFEAALADAARIARPDPGQGVRRAPADMLAAMLARRAKLVLTAERDAAAIGRDEAADAQTKAWRAAWDEALQTIPAAEGEPPLLWYVRRRAIADHAAAIGVPMPIGANEEAIAAQLAARMNELGLANRLAALNGAATTFAAARIAALLGAPGVEPSDIVLGAALRDLEAAAAKLPPAAPGAPRRLLSSADVIEVQTSFADPALGDGLARALKATDGAINRDGQLWLASTGRALPLDRAGRSLSDSELQAFAKALAKAIRDRSEAALDRLIGGVA